MELSNWQFPSKRRMVVVSGSSESCMPAARAWNIGIDCPRAPYASAAAAVGTHTVQRYQQIDLVVGQVRDTKRGMTMVARRMMQCCCPSLSTRRLRTTCAALNDWSGWSLSRSYSSVLFCYLSECWVQPGACTEVAASIYKGMIHSQQAVQIPNPTQTAASANA